MAAKPPSLAIKTMLVDRDIALWDAHHYNTATGRPTTKDPVSVCLMTPRAVDQMFYGKGATTDEAVLDCLARNTGLKLDEPGVTGALARLENEMHALGSACFSYRWDTLGQKDDLDADVPF